MNMQNWKEQMIYTELKKPMPILSFPSVQDLYITVRELVADENHQAIGMRIIADSFDMPAAMGYMDLSVEAEAFGAHTVYSADEVPSILGHILSTEEDVEKLTVPEVGAAARERLSRVSARRRYSFVTARFLHSASDRFRLPEGFWV